MKVYTYSEARQQLSRILEEAAEYGEVRIRRRDGSTFVVRPQEVSGSPLDVPGIDLDPPITADEIVAAVREGRERD